MFHKVILPVDAFSPDAWRATQSVARALADWGVGAGAEIRLVYAMTPKSTHVPPREFPKWQDYYAGEAEDRLRRLAGSLPGEASRERLVLCAGVRSTRAAVRTVVEHAVTWGAEMIALSTHARTGVDRLFLGSFAETLLLKSPVPSLVVPPEKAFVPSSNRVLFPSDLVDVSPDRVARVTALCRATGADLLLYHLETPPFWLLTPPGLAAHDEVERAAAYTRGRLQELRQQFEKGGVKVSTEIESGGLGGVASAIASAVKRHGASLVVMETRSAKERPVFFGGTARQVVRVAPCPVLTLPSSID